MKKTKSVINPKNEDDNECFKWAVTAALYPVDKNANQISKYVENSKNLCWDGVEFPATRKDIKAFKKVNPNVAINVVALAGRIRYPWYTSEKKRTRESKIRTANLLLVQALADGDEVKTHLHQYKKPKQTTEFTD